MRSIEAITASYSVELYVFHRVNWFPCSHHRLILVNLTIINLEEQYTVVTTGGEEGKNLIGISLTVGEFYITRLQY